MKLFISVLLSLAIFSFCNRGEELLPDTELSIAEFALGEPFEKCYEAASDNPASSALMIQDSDSCKVVMLLTRLKCSGTKTIPIDVGIRGDDIVRQMSYTVSNKDYSDDYVQVLDYLNASYGDIKPQKIRWKEKRGEYQVVHKHLDYHYCWRFSEGYVLAIERTHWMAPFSDQVVHEGLSVQYRLYE